MAQPELEAIELAMRELLTMLRGEDTAAEELQAAWARCSTVGGGIEAVLERLKATGPADGSTREALDRLVQLNAIIRQAVVAQQDALASSLAQTRETGTQVRGYAPAAPVAGGKCDLAG